ncbi:MAG: tyrosine-type recombinase/integrase [Candidatus Pacebacteria bacterium]|nr:tyrosine-type recombinase/integrase [Candidatus Paceibacterota bacterium]
MDIKMLAERFYNYSLQIRGFSKNTVNRYKSIIDPYCEYSNIAEIGQVSEKNIRQMFFHGRMERKWCSGTYICNYRALKVFFDWCIKEGHMKDNPMLCLELPRLEKRLPVKLTKQESSRLLEVVFNYPYDYEYLRYRNYAIFSLFLFAGLRRSELLKLKLTNIDIENLTIFVSQGKGSKDRMIPINFTLAETLKRYLVERKRLNKTCPELFCSLNRNMGYTSEGLRRLVKQIREASGIEFACHKLRHTFATLLLENGADIYSISKMMGHREVNINQIPYVSEEEASLWIKELENSIW